MKVSN